MTSHDSEQEITAAGYESLAKSMLEILQQPISVPNLSKGLWLTGPAGVGKSFLVATVVHQLAQSMQTSDNSNSNNNITRTNHPHHELYWFSVWDLWSQLEADATASMEEIVQWLWEELDQNHQQIILQHPTSIHGQHNNNNHTDMDETDDSSTTDRITVVFDDLHCILDILHAEDGQLLAGSQRALAERLHAALVVFCQQILPCPAVAVIGIARPTPQQQQSINTTTSMIYSINLLDIHFHMDAPSNRQRAMLLQQLLLVDKQSGLGVSPADATEWANVLADRTAGCVASDLVQLCRRAQLLAQSSSSTKEHDDDINDTVTAWMANPPPTIHDVRWEHVMEAARTLVPSQLEFLDVIHPPVIMTKDEENKTKTTRLSWYEQHQLAWKPFAGYATLIHRIYRTIVLPHRSSSQQVMTMNEDMNDTTTISVAPIDPPRGVIFHGPSGCGKSLAATCLGAALGWPMIRVAPVNVLDKYLGGSEALLRQYFAKARQAAPCILLLEEIDAIAANRNNSDDGDDTTGGVMSRLLSTLLNEMDGIASSPASATSMSSSSPDNRVLCVACTNRMDRLDAALLRPGRLEEHVEIPLPNVEDAIALLQHYWFSPSRGGIVTDDDINYQALAEHLVNHCHGTAATMEGVAREAVLQCIRRCSSSDGASGSGDDLRVSQNDVNIALKALFLE